MLNFHKLVIFSAEQNHFYLVINTSFREHLQLSENLQFNELFQKFTKSSFVSMHILKTIGFTLDLKTTFKKIKMIRQEKERVVKP